MTTFEKIKWMNVGIGLQKHYGENCSNLTGEPVGEGTSKQFYIGLDETADLFIEIIKDMGLEDIIKTEKIDVDGECELRVEVVR